MSIIIKSWVGRRGDIVRDYIQNIADIIGLEVIRYGSGNISGASGREGSILDGQHISNIEAGRLSAIKAYYQDGELHVQMGNVRIINADQVIAAIHAAAEEN